MNCKFCSCCKYYGKLADTCHNEDEARAGCAAHWQFEEFGRGNQNIGTSIANLVVIRINDAKEISAVTVSA